MAVSAAPFRRVLSMFPTGVVVITAQVDDKPVGMAVNSFTSVSLEPPLVLWCAGKSSETWPVLRRAGSFAVNILAEDQAELVARFASKEVDRFSGVGHRGGLTGAPILDGVLACLEADIDAELDAGDHWIVLGLVRGMDILRENGAPLVFCRGGYGHVSTVTRRRPPPR